MIVMIQKICLYYEKVFPKLHACITVFRLYEHGLDLIIHNNL